MFFSQSLTISEASILFYSHHYKNLKCRVVEKSTSIILCSRLINNCLETVFSLNCGLEDFVVELLQGQVLVGVFSFTYQDLDQVIAQDSNLNNYNHFNTRRKKRKYIKFKKQNDSCSLYFTIQVKDIIAAEDSNFTEGYLYQDFLRNIANKVYKKLQKKAVNTINRIQITRLRDKKLSLLISLPLHIQANKNYKQLNLQPIQQQIQSISTPQPINQNCNSNHQFKRYLSFSRSWNGLTHTPISKSKLQVKGQNQKEYNQLKNQYKLKKIRQRVKNIFKKQIKQKQAKQMIIIPEIKTNKLDIRQIKLLSEGIILPQRIKSQNNYDLGVKLQGFLEKYQPQYAKYSNFSSQIFESQLSQNYYGRTTKLQSIQKRNNNKFLTTIIRGQQEQNKIRRQKLKQKQNLRQKQLNKKTQITFRQGRSKILKKTTNSTKQSEHFKNAVKFK